MGTENTIDAVVATKYGCAASSSARAGEDTNAKAKTRAEQLTHRMDQFYTRIVFVQEYYCKQSAKTTDRVGIGWGVSSCAGAVARKMDTHKTDWFMTIRGIGYTRGAGVRSELLKTGHRSNTENSRTVQIIADSALDSSQ